MKIDSPNWIDGVCIKHSVPETPCPACLAESDEEVEFIVNESDIDVCCSEKIPLTNLVPVSFQNPKFRQAF
jgi:hypothetical protein